MKESIEMNIGKINQVLHLPYACHTKSGKKKKQTRRRKKKKKTLENGIIKMNWCNSDVKTCGCDQK